MVNEFNVNWSLGLNSTGLPGVDDLNVTVVDPGNASTEELKTLHAQTADRCIIVHGILNMISCNSLGGKSIYSVQKNCVFIATDVV